MNAKIRITNQEKYNEKVHDIDIDDLSATDFYNAINGNFCATGTLVINVKEDDGSISQLESFGEHGSRDYEDEYGFVLEVDES